tara:strand:+ start:175 stop:300 length:126 start_codon:yes stop_codon:yes gene_type:complete
MIKNIAASVVTGALSIAFLGLIGICMARDTIKEIDVGPFDK